MVKRKMASDQWSNPKAGHTEYHMVKPITVENRYCDYPGNKGKVISVFYRNKCHKMIVTLSMVTHLGPGQNSHNIRFLQ